MLNERYRIVGRVLLLALLWSGGAARAAPAAAGTESNSAVDASPTSETPAAVTAPKKQPSQSDTTTAKEPDEFNPSESLSEDATVAYPVDI